MKSYIRFKVKHILVVLVAVIGIAGLSYIFMPSLIYSLGENYYRGGEAATAKVYFDRVEHYFPNHPKTAEALERAAEITSQDNFLMVSPMGIGSWGRRGGLISKEALKYYETLIDRFPQTWQGQRAKKELTVYKIRNYINEGKISAALALLDSYIEDENRSHTQHDVVMSTARRLVAVGYYNEVIELIEGYVENLEISYSNPDMFELLADAHGILGNKEEALAYYDRVFEIYDEILEMDREFSDGNVGSPNTYYQEKELEIKGKISILKSDPLEMGTITGSINLGGEPLGDVEMILQPLNNPYMYPMGSPEAIWTTSDKKGKFTFDNLIPGRYGVGFVLYLEEVGDVILKGGRFPQSILYVDEGETKSWDFELVETMKMVSPLDDAVIEEDYMEFIWEPFEGAAYYTIDFGIYGESVTVSWPHDDRYYTNRAKFSIHELRSLQIGFSFDEEGPVPESLFGLGMPGGRYFWGVKAHGEDGRVLTSSQGYLISQNSDFSFPEKGLKKADKLLLNREYNKAINAYEKELERDPEDIHSLYMLAQLYGFSMHQGRDDYDYNYTNLDKSLDYYYSLYELTGNINYLDGAVKVYYDGKKDYQKALETLRIIEREKGLSDWQAQQVARLEASFGNYNTALNELLKSGRKFLKEESALRIIAGDFLGMDSYAARDDEEEKWLEAIMSYKEDYEAVNSSLSKTLEKMPVAKAKAVLEGQSLPPEKELILLALKTIDPSYRHNLLLEDVESYIEKYSKENPDLARYARTLFYH